MTEPVIVTSEAVREGSTIVWIPASNTPSAGRHSDGGVMRRTVPVLVTAVALVGFAAGACSSSSTAPNAGGPASTRGRGASTTTRATTAKPATTDSSTTAAPATSTTAAASDGDTAIAARAALNENDLPSFTSVAPPQPNAATVAQNRAFARCVGAHQSLVEAETPPGDVRRLFVNGNIHILNVVHVFPTAADAAPRFDAYAKPSTPACLGA